MEYKRFFLTIILWMITACCLTAQISDIRFHHLTIEDGLSQSTVQTIYQDQEGYIWFGTQDGLNKFDGYDITIYKHDPEDDYSLSHDDIRVIYEDKRGNLWIGTQVRGLNLYDREMDRFIHYVGSSEDEDWQTLSSNTVWTMLEDSRENFWVGTSYGLNLMNREEGTFSRIFSDENDPSSLSHNHISKLYEDTNGTLWVGTSEGLNELNRKDTTFTRYLHPDGEIDHAVPRFIRAIYEDRQGMLWVGTEEHGLYYLDRDENIFKNYIDASGSAPFFRENAIYSILEDTQGNLWIGTGNDGLHVLNRETKRFYSYRYHSENPNSLNNNGINSLYETKDQIFWIGTFAGGVNFRDPSTDKFRHYRNDPLNRASLSNNSVQSILKDRLGNVWIGTDGGGLNLFDPDTGEFQHYRYHPNNSNGLSNDVILDMAESEEGIWLGTYGGGVDLFDIETRSFQNFSHDPEDPASLSSDHVFKVFKSSDGLLWFGTNWGGITVFDPASNEYTRYESDFEQPDDPSTVDNNDIREIYEDSDGIIWIGSYGERLTRFDREEGRFSFFDINVDDTIYSSVIQSIHEDHANRFWLGTRGGGLKLFDRETQEVMSFSVNDGLPSNIVHAIVEDEQGYLWLSTNNGISRFDPDSKNFLNYGLESGVQSKEFNPRSAYRDDNGFIYFGGVNGFNRFHPDSIRSDTTSYPVVLTDFQIFNRPVPIHEDSPLQKQISQTETLTLSHEASVITFGYSALNFSEEKRNQFAYKLDGFEEDWNYVGDQRRATYTNLDPGEYTFRVMASNSDGIWNESGTSLTLIVTPPFWQTNWFIGLMIVGLTGSVLLIFRIRIKSIRRQNKRLAEIINSRTHELKRANATKDKLFSIISHDLNNVAAGLVGLSELLKTSVEEGKTDDIKQYTGYLHDTSTRFLSMLKNLLAWARSQSGQIEYTPRKFRIDDLVDEVVAQEKSRAFNKGIDLTYSINSVFEVYADPDMTIVILRNLVHNALKFTEKGGEVKVKTDPHGEYVVISVSDNGIGMDDETIRKILDHEEQVTSKQGTSREKGTGIGLPLCRDFIERNGGEMKVESKVGEGTTISFMLPINEHSSLDSEEKEGYDYDILHA